MKHVKKAMLIMLTIISVFSLAGCGGGGGTTYDNDYKPGNPQYDYDAWKYGQDHPGFYDD